MELPKWTFKADSRVGRDDQIDIVFSLRPLGRLWLSFHALVELIRTSTITIAIRFQDGRPRVTHQGEVIEPKLDYILEDKDLHELVDRTPMERLTLLILLAQARYADLFAAAAIRPAVQSPRPPVRKGG